MSNAYSVGHLRIRNIQIKSSYFSDERKVLADVPNAVAYHRIIETAACGYLVRQYIHSSLYDRLR
jgi:phosphoinositide-3-kinase regulatory subunit 4